MNVKKILQRCSSIPRLNTFSTVCVSFRFFYFVSTALMRIVMFVVFAIIFLCNLSCDIPRNVFYFSILHISKVSTQQAQLAAQ